MSSSIMLDIFLKKCAVIEVSSMHPQDRSSITLETRLLELGVQLSEQQLVTWRRDSRDHPRNWSRRRKFYDILVVATLEFYTTAISTTGPSAAAIAKTEYGLGALSSLVAFSFVYQLGQAFGGLIIPPYSESFGRRTPYIVSSAVFAIFSLLVGIVPSVVMVFIGRFVSGFASAVPSVVLAGSIEDMFNSRWRVWLVLVWNALSTAGLVFGPIYGVYISNIYGWRWIYYSAAIGTAVLTVLLFGILESRPSLLLGKKVDILRKEFKRDFSHDNHDAVVGSAMLFDVVLIRPAKLLISEPLVIMVTTLFAISWAIVYLFTEALTGIYSTMGFSKTTASLPFLAIGVGVLFSVLPRFQDMKIARRRRLRNEPLEPEDKMAGFTFAVASLAIGLWWFAWTIPPAVTTVSWVVPTIGLVFVGFAVNEMAYTLSGYLADSYTVYAASAFAALASVRAIVSGLMPLVAYAMYSNMSANLATSVVAVTATLFGAAPYLLYRYSKDMRGRSPFAKYSLDVHVRTRVEED